MRKLLAKYLNIWWGPFLYGGRFYGLAFTRFGIGVFTNKKVEDE